RRDGVRRALDGAEVGGRGGGGQGEQHVPAPRADLDLDRAVAAEHRRPRHPRLAHDPRALRSRARRMYTPSDHHCAISEAPMKAAVYVGESTALSLEQVKPN